ncbi:MAG: T9SS type A sorting domain-containing protein, partial [Flavobacteriales bacterium]|nr:T9SS type A sorting domain-containing protein [Flavobacteriales bacterium]
NWTAIDAGASFSLNCGFVGVNEESTAQSFSIYPNPVNSQLNIKSEEKIETITIMDIMGKTLETIVTPNSTINVSHLTKGIYFLQIQMDNRLVSKKFIKE